MSIKLYVGNLSFNTTENCLQDLFASAGTVKEALIVQDKMSGQSRGFGFVTMATQEEAKSAEQQFNGKEFQGRELVVNEARKREDSPARSGGGGGGGGGNRRRNNY